MESDYSKIVSYSVPLPVTYSLTASASDKGSISPSGSISILKGESQTFMIAPDPNYHIADVIIDGKSIGATSEYAFTNIKENHSIEASFATITVEFSMEFGEVSANHKWQQVLFTRKFVNIVVIAASLSMNGSDPSTVRIDNITSTGFEISVEEWDYLDGPHINESIGYVVMEAGSFTLPDGTTVEAGTFASGPSSDVALAGKFAQTPVVIASVASYNDPDAVTVRLQNISKNQFGYQVQEQEANTDGHASETISYIAWEACRTAVNGFMVEVAKTGDIMNQTFKKISFMKPFAAPPVFVASMQTKDGYDPASLRWKNRTGSNVEVKIEEEQSKDTETIHTTEVVGYITIGME